MIYKVVDRRALGGASVFGRPLSAPRAGGQKTLGRATLAAINTTRLDYEKSARIYERILVNYQNLASIMGKDKADQAVLEAKAAMDAAAQAHNDSLEVAK